VEGVQNYETKGNKPKDPSEINGDNLNNIKRETSMHFKNKNGISERQN
jgi:hypothetical protein